MKFDLGNGFTVSIWYDGIKKHDDGKQYKIVINGKVIKDRFNDYDKAKIFAFKTAQMRINELKNKIDNVLGR